jgi:hypothetical protein
MYANPAHIKHKRVNLSLNEQQFERFFARAASEGKQVTPMIFELALMALDLVEGHASDVAANDQKLRRANA